MISPLLAKQIKSINELFSQKLYSTASLELSNFVHECKQEDLDELTRIFEEYVYDYKFEEALAIGVGILSKKGQDYKLINKLGNIARISGDMDQALGLYKHALIVNPRYETPLINISATLAHSERVDIDALHAAHHFPPGQKFLLPEYFIFENGEFLNNSNYENEIESSVKKLANTPINDKVSINVESFPNLPKLAKEYLLYFEHLAKNDPERPLLHHYNQIIYCCKNRHLAMAASLLKKFPQPKQNLYPLKYIRMIEAFLLAEASKFNEAEDLLNILLGEENNNRYFNANMGLVCRRQGKKIKANLYLIKTFDLIVNSNMLFEVKEYIQQINKKFKNGSYALAKSLYQRLIDEGLKDALVFFNMAIILLAEKDYLQSVEYFRKSASSDIDYKIMAETQVGKIFKFVFSEGDRLHSIGNFPHAFQQYLICYKINKTREVIRKIIQTSELLSSDQFDELLIKKMKSELRELDKNAAAQKHSQNILEHQMKITEMRGGLLQEAEEDIKNKRYYNAIQKLESAFRIKPDKETFLKLASLYKGMNKNDQLINLAQRYKKYIEHVGKMKRFEEDMTVKL